MKQLLLLLFLACSVLAMELEFDKKFTNTVEPDLIQTDIKITADAQSEQAVSQILQKVSVFIDGYSQVQKSGGNLVIKPRYNHQQDQRVLQGYKGQLEYTISSKEFNYVEVFLQDLLANKQKENITVSKLGYILSKDKRENQLEKLRFKAILWGISYAKNLSSKIYQQCKVAKIDFKQQRGPVLLRSNSAKTNGKKELTRDFIPNPIKEAKTLYMQPQFELKCSDDS